MITLHFHLAVLVLLDTIPSLPENGASPSEHTKIRKRSCVATVNALSAALQIHGDVLQYCNPASILLLDPTPEGLVLAIQRTTSSLIQLHEDGEISSRSLKCTLPVLLKGLNHLSEICEGTEGDIAHLENLITSVRGSAPKLDASHSGKIRPLLLMRGQNVEYLGLGKQTGGSSNPSGALEREEDQRTLAIAVNNAIPELGFEPGISHWDIEACLQ